MVVQPVNYLRFGRLAPLAFLVLIFGSCDSFIFAGNSHSSADRWTLGLYGPDAMPPADRLLRSRDPARPRSAARAESSPAMAGSRILVLDAAGLWEISTEPGAHAPRPSSPVSPELTVLLEPQTAEGAQGAPAAPGPVNHADPALLRAFATELGLRAGGGPIALQITGSGSGYRQDREGSSALPINAVQGRSIIRSGSGEGLQVQTVAAALNGSGLNLLVLDAPRTAAIEVVLELSTSAQTILAAPDDPGAEAWDVRVLAAALETGLPPQDAELGAASPAPVSIATERIEAVHLAFDALCEDAVSELAGQAPDQVAFVRDTLFAGAVPDAWTTPGDLSLDLWGLVAYLGEALPSLQTAVLAVQQALDACVLGSVRATAGEMLLGVHFVPLSGLGAPLRHRDEYFADSVDPIPGRFVRESRWAPRLGGADRGLLDVLWY